jgi:hypothetical protein
MQLPNPPWYRRWSVILAGVIGLAMITALLGWRGLQDVATSETTATTRSAAAATTSAPTTPPTSLRQPQTSRAPGVLWEETATNESVGKSHGFEAPARWHIEWSFDCSNFRKYGGGNFKITGDGAFERIQIQEFDVEASGSRTFTRGGFGHLLVDSVCKRWTVTVLTD